MADKEMYTAPELSQDLRDEEKADDAGDDAAAATGSDEERRFEPLHGGTRPNTLTRPGSGTTLHSLSPSPSASFRRMRSQNGHGCAESDGPDELNDALARDGFEVVWDSDQDPQCPRSMSQLHKWIIVVIVSMGALCVTCASSIYTSTYAQMNPEFGISTIVGTLGLSTFVLGISLGPLLMSPLSEFYGRRPIYLASWTMFLIWNIPSAVARNATTMIVARFFDGFAGSAFLSVSGGTISDVFKRDAIQAPMVLISLSPFIGPSLGPLLGGFINTYANWRFTYWFLIIWAAFILLAILLFAPETYHPIKLRDKARSLRKETGEERWKAPMEKTNKSIARTVGYSLLRPFQLLMYEPMCLLLCLFSAVLLGIIYLFFGAFGLIFGDVYGFNLWQTGLAFLGMLFGMIAASATDPVWHRVHDGLFHRNNDRSEPEFRLPPAIAGAIMVPVGLFWFAWTTYPSIHWMVPIIGSGVFGMGSLLVFTGVFTFLVDAYPQYAASALAANAFVRCAFAAAFPLFGLQMYHKIGYQWGSSLLAFLTVVMMPFPYLFFRYGKRLRKNSRFAT